MQQALPEEQLTALKRDWVSGLLSTRLLRIKHGLNDDDIVEQIAAQEGWPPRNMRARIEEETTRALIDRAVSDAHPGEPQLIDDDAQVAAYGQQVASVVESQRKAVNKGRVLADQMLDELAAIQPPKVDENAIQTLAFSVEKHNPELAQHLREHIGPVSPGQKMTFLNRRIGMLKTISEAHERYIGMEREAWGLDGDKAPQMEFDAILTALDTRRVGH
jgi:hypothetical protein